VNVDVDAAPARRWWTRLAGGGWGGGSGPMVAAAFHRALGAVFVVAWLSLGSQVRLLVGGNGLLPLAEMLEAARAEGWLSIATFPSVLALAPGDGALLAGTVVGAALGALALLGVWPRVMAGAGAVLYLSYVAACRSFLAFQWDNLLLECGLLAVFLPRHRRAPVAHFLLRALLFKLYFESGLAKLQSPAGDWLDGSAMTHYYETAPLPTFLAWHAHNLPRWWHLFESWATLALELVVPFLAFGPRKTRLGAAAALTLFQIGNAGTGNYGFFCYLAMAMHLFLFDDADLVAAAARTRTLWSRTVGRLRVPPSIASAGAKLCRLLGRRSPAPAPAPAGHARRAAALVGAAVWIGLSLAQAQRQFGSPGRATQALMPALELAYTLRVVNNYYLFASVTTERIEPTIETEEAGAWTVRDLRYKPGDPRRAPPVVAPHQPRVDFQLWFYGLRANRMPIYVSTLLGRVCEDPGAVQQLFAAPLPRAPDAVRITFHDYRFTSPEERRATGAYWRTRSLGSTPRLPCAR
jgi:lipase maturation factor 1